MSDQTDDVTHAILGNDPRLGAVGKGWHKLVLPLLLRADEEGAGILQIKEKYGTLRFYVVGASEELRAMIDKAEDESGVTCESCGAPGKLRHGGWIRCLCDACDHSDAMQDGDPQV